MVTAYAVHPEITKAGNMIFRMIYTGPTQGRAMAIFSMDKLSYKTFHLLYLDNDYGKSISEGFQQTVSAKGGQVLSSKSFGAKDSDFSPQLTAMKDTPADALILVGYYLTIAIATLQALGLYLIAGLAGQVSLGHAAFGLCGAYVAGMLNTRLNWAPWLTVPAAGVFGGCFGALIALPSLRVRDDFLAIVTLGFGLVIPALLRGNEFLGGTYGLSSISFLSTGPAYLTIRLAIGAGLLIPIALFVWRLEHSAEGLIWRAIANDEIAAAACGVNVLRSRLMAFSFGAGISGLGGALLAHHLGFVNSDTYTFSHSMIFLSMVVIGAANGQWGVMVTAALLTALFEILRPLESYRMTIYGLLLVGMMHYRYRRSFKWFRSGGPL